MSNTTDPIAHFDRFTEAVRQRLEQGRDAYGDASFDTSPDALLSELSQEALDLAGWGFVLWLRVERMRERLAARGGSD